MTEAAAPAGPAERAGKADPPAASRPGRRAALLEFGAVLAACAVASAAFTAPWHPNSRSIPTPFRGGGDFFARIDATMWTYMLAWGAEHPDRFYSAPVLMPLPSPLLATDPRLTEGFWSIPLFRLLDPVLAWGVTLWIALLATGVGSYYAGRILTGARWGGAAVAVLFAFGMFRATHICRVEATFAPFLALALVAMARFLESPGRIAAAAFALALAAAAVEYSYVAVPLALILPVAFLWGLWRRRVPPARGLAPLLLAGALAAAILFPVARRYADFHGTSGMERSIRQVDTCSADLHAWLTGPTGRILPPFGPEGNDMPDGHLFPGFVAVALGVAGLGALRRKSPELVLVGVLALAVSFGTLRMLFWQAGLPAWPARTPYEFLYDLLLPIRAIRAPARFGVLVHGVLALAGAFAVARMAGSRKGRWLAAAALAAAFLEARAGMHAVAIRPARMDDPVYGWLAAQPGDFAVLEAPMGLHAVRDQHLAEGEAMLAARVHGKRTPNGTMAAETPWHDSIAVNTANPRHAETLRVLQALGVRYVTARDAAAAQDWERAGYRRVCDSSAGLSVLEVASPLPVPVDFAELARRLEGDPFLAAARSGAVARGARLRAPAEFTVRACRRFVLPVRVRNTGPAAWSGNSFLYGRGGRGDVMVGIRAWRSEGDGEAARGPRGEILTAPGFLPTNLASNETAQVFVSSLAPSRPGLYRAELDLAVAGAGWVSPPDRPPVTVRVRVE